MRRHAVLFALLVIVTLIGGFIVGCATGGQPHMNAALDELRAARSELQVSTADKGGHRERAIGLCDQAIGEVEAGIEFARTH